MKQADPFPRLLRAFFYEWMVEQRNASVHTVRSYRDTWRLFLRFVAQRGRRKVAQLTLGDLTASEVSAFLQICRAGTARLDRYAQLPSCRAAQLLRVCRRTGANVLTTPVLKDSPVGSHWGDVESAVAIPRPSRTWPIP
jgi:hypothetical protein